MNVIDFEASSLSDSSYPIQVGVVKDDGSEYMAYILPMDRWTDWSLKSQSIHNITPRMLSELGKPAVQVAHELNDFIGNDTVFCDGGTYDIHWANRLYADTGTDRIWNIGDVLQEALKGAAEPKTIAPWWHIKEEYAVDNNVREHDALNDARLIRQIAMAIQES